MSQRVVQHLRFAVCSLNLPKFATPEKVIDVVLVSSGLKFGLILVEKSRRIQIVKIISVENFPYLEDRANL